MNKSHLDNLKKWYAKDPQLVRENLVKPSHMALINSIKNCRKNGIDLEALFNEPVETVTVKPTDLSSIISRSQEKRIKVQTERKPKRKK